MGRTPGVYQDAKSGEWRVDKVVRGHRLQGRGHRTRQEAEDWLVARIAELQARLPLADTAMTFGAAARRYVTELHEAGTDITTKSFLLTPVIEHIGELALDQVYDDTLKPFVRARLAQGLKASTVNRSLEVVRHILNTAARRWRVQVPGGKTVPVLATAPVITMLDEDQDSREARPITWDEQRRLLPALPVHLARMALFCLNTGLRDKPLRNLRWSWERRVKLDDKEISVFEVPKEFVKGGKRKRYVVCNSVAQSIVDSVRGQHPEFVFVYRHNEFRRASVSKGTARKDHTPKPARPLLTGLSNTGWAAGCKEAGLEGLHVHDLRHTVGMRLREAGVPEETRAEVLWHVYQGMPQHYAVAQVREVYEALERIKDESGRSNISLRMLSLESATAPSPSTVPAAAPQQRKRA